MSDIYLYKNRMWKVMYNFTYTGSIEQFTLPAGEYLCICKGAKGGLYQNYSPHQNLGGTSYGILHPNAPITLYAVVGGDGGNGGGDGSWGTKYGHGGFNGGGNGGRGARCNNFRGGAGGGGASDIRLSGLPLTTEKVRTVDDYMSVNNYELTYIESDGTQWLNLGIVSPWTKIEVVCEITETAQPTYSALFGTRYTNSSNQLVLYTRYSSSNTKIGISYGNNESSFNKSIPRNQKIKIIYDKGTVSWYDMNGDLIDSATNTASTTGLYYPLYLFNVNHQNSTKSSSNPKPYCDWYSSAKIYYLKTYDDGELTRWCVPWTNTSDPDYPYISPNDAGLYDLVNDVVYNAENIEGVNRFGFGEYVAEGFKTEYHYWEPNEEVLNTRIMVAGGGGGGQGVPNDAVNDFTGFGGGVTGGYPFTLSYTWESSQTKGNEFGIGGNAPDKVTERNYKNYSAEGLSGGGGGWYGGCTSFDVTINSRTNTMDNGGGGSGYILTESSYKPTGYLDGYDYSDLYFSDTFMSCGSAEEACVIICKPTQEYNVGDRIICDCIGEGERFPLIKGNYTVTCYGGDGGSRNYASSVGRGGFATGTFTNPINQDAFVYVGGSTFPANKVRDDAVQTMFPTIGFNGGGAIGGVSDTKLIGIGAGGGTDLRIGEDSLYSRIIVAGGAGGQGQLSSTGGAGGGTTGGNYNGSYGTNGGPGTQTTAGTSSDYPAISGGFGYGGNGLVENSGYGGSGGGGWYGGSGTKPNGSNDNDRSGSGGSGFVFTNGAVVPERYKLDSSYCMTGTTLTQGGNNLPKGVTKLMIDINSISNVLFLVEDSYGYKYFDNDDEEWKLLNVSTLTPEIFEQYGVYMYSSDTGLDDEYHVIAYDPDNIVNTANMYVVPPELTIETTYYTRRAITKYTIDMDIDPETTTFVVDEEHKGVGDESRVEFTMKCNMTDVPDKDFRLYCIYGYTAQGGSVYHEPVPPKPPVQPKQYLLHVGVGTTFPSRYKTYMRGYIGESTAITSVDAGVSCESNRNIYTCSLCNNTLYRITKLNLISNTSYQIKDITKSNLGSYPPGDIKVDDKYIYFVGALNDGTRELKRTPLDPNDPTVSTYIHGSDNNKNFNAVGKMEWLDDTHLIILYHQGFTVFDTKEYTFTDMPSGGVLNAGSRDMAVGKKHAIVTPTTASTNLVICELATNTWSTLSSTGQSLNLSQLVACCYGDGYFYLTQKNYIYIMDDETLEIVQVITTPYTDQTPKLIMYSNQNLFIVMQNAHLAYIYDIQSDKFGATNIPFTIDDWSASAWVRGCAYRGYMFLPNMKLFTVNFTEYAKYDIGYVNDQFLMATNSVNVEHQTYTYDERFVTFTEDNMWIHPGYITRTLNTYDTDMKYATFNKNEYNKYLSLDTTHEEEPIPPEPEPE